VAKVSRQVSTRHVRVRALQDTFQGLMHRVKCRGLQDCHGQRAGRQKDRTERQIRLGAERRRMQQTIDTRQELIGIAQQRNR